jgi:predicted transcriptional regulator
LAATELDPREKYIQANRLEEELTVWAHKARNLKAQALAEMSDDPDLDMSYAEIAAEVGLSPQTVRNLADRARGKPWYRPTGGRRGRPRKEIS